NSKREACERAEAKGRAEGEAKGKTEGKIEVAKAMLHEGLAVEIICKVTGLSEKQVKDLQD
ncbi:MAG: hypothetical protein MJY49_03240, partial [Bacteroidales bacterium]|nr:hypothetical protein [Bacteroidales bacterium]